ncbi:Cytochrome c oxidase subunit 6A1, mitochondrial [Lamellibrachia satsuma]|nr:Cytochrome c oxidase subunit 6A1, mitochondrial [Lamellibrachia satsuma]
MWRILSFTVAVPGVIVTYINASMTHKEEHERLKDEGRPKFIPYTHLRRRTKKFPWGDGQHTLFHNPSTNAMPGGYED